MNYQPVPNFSHRAFP